MNLIVGFVILLCLVFSEINSAEVANDLWTRVSMVFAVAMLVPGLALFQTLIVTRRMQHTEIPDEQRDIILRRLSICHSAVWLAASVAIVWAIRWQDVVRGNWNLDQWPLIDELLILAPILFSLAASWAIFYEIQGSLGDESSSRIRFDVADWRRRIAYVSIRFRIYVLLVLIPIAIAVLARDAEPWIRSVPNWTAVVAYGVGTIVVMASFPFLILLIWQNHAVPNEELRTELRSTCKDLRLHIFDIRVWKTGGQIINALVAGILPKFRVILLSDELLNRFPKNELLAIVRHEAGHLRLWHLPIRIGFTVLPLIALTIDEQNPSGILATLESMFSHAGLASGTGLVLVGLVYLIYLYFSVSWLSHKMEFEADIFSCQTIGKHESMIDSDLATDMSDALLRLASITPGQYEKKSLLHPSIKDRIRVIHVITSSPNKAEKFKASFARRRRFVLGFLVVICIAALLIQI
ncbi:MAG: M48 family metallopeptidase [Mariniblastus sp.]